MGMDDQEDFEVDRKSVAVEQKILYTKGWVEEWLCGFSAGASLPMFQGILLPCAVQLRVFFSSGQPKREDSLSLSQWFWLVCPWHFVSTKGWCNY